MLWLVSSTVPTSWHFSLISVVFFLQRKKLRVSVKLLMQGKGCIPLSLHFNSHCILWLHVQCKKHYFYYLQQTLHQASHWAVPSLWKVGKVLGKAWSLQSSVFLHSLLFKWLLINKVQKMALKWLMMSANIAAWKCHIAGMHRGKRTQHWLEYTINKENWSLILSCPLQNRSSFDQER